MFLKKLVDEKSQLGPGPSTLECRLLTGHTGVSLDGGRTILGFNPETASHPVWLVMDRLRDGDAFPGIVTEDTTIFAEARWRGLTIHTFDVILPEPHFQGFVSRLDGERRNSNHTYGFPNGDGDCNCTTWLERLGLPLLTGRMDEFINLCSVWSNTSHRFGECRP